MLVQTPSGPVERSAQPSPSPFMLASTVTANGPSWRGAGPWMT